MRRDGLRIDPKARPYGMQAFDLLAELLPGMEVTLKAPVPPHGRRLLLALGVKIKIARAASRGTSGTGLVGRAAPAGPSGDDWGPPWAA